MTCLTPSPCLAASTLSGARAASPLDADILQALPFLMHALLLAALLVMIRILFRTVTDEEDRIERLMRCVSLFVGLLVVLSCAAMGISIASFVVDSLTLAHPFRLFSVGVAVPILAGVIAGRYFTQALNGGDEVAVRFVLFVSAIAVTLYIDVYIAVLGGVGVLATKQLFPNVLFAGAMGLYMMKNVRPRKPAQNDYA
jgi:hypothetical protein